MRNSKSAYLFTYNNIWKLVYILIINAGFYSPITVIQSGQTYKQTNKLNEVANPY